MRRFPNLDVQADARKRSANGHKAKAAGAVVWVDGQLVSITAIGERLGVDRSTAGKRLRAAQRSEGPVTWAKLEGRG